VARYHYSENCLSVASGYILQISDNGKNQNSLENSMESTVLLKVAVARLANKLPAVQETQILKTMFTKARHGTVPEPVTSGSHCHNLFL
jgi:hypothetical protein